MALEREVYEALESVVGKRNISEDPGVTESYRCIASQSSAHYGPYDHKTPRPQAVILPATTGEVQQIVKLCNEHRIEFKASTTFWSAMGYVGSDRAVQLDMRRMRGLEIDSKNMIAVIEPYAIGAVVQAEAMKVGLTCNIPGVGCSSSVLASSAGWVGFGPTSIFMGCASENMLGAEWVLPDGEILRTGTLGAGSGWFCGEGPGPSIRAILRGFQGSTGTMGVCTRMAIRLHPWAGPPELPTYGTVPAYKADLPENIKGYTLCFPDWDAYAKAVAIFHENDILFMGHRQYNMFGRDLKAAMITILSDPDRQLADLPALVADPKIRKANDGMKIDVQIIITGFSRSDMEYKEKAVDRILEISGGWKSEFMEDPEIANWVLAYLVRLGRKNLNYVMCGAYEGNFGLSSNLHVSCSVMEEASALKRKWEKESAAIAATGGDSDMGSICIIGGGGPTGWEFFTNFDAYDKESIRGTKEFFDDTQRWMSEKGLGVDMGRWNETARKPDGYHYSQDEHDEIFSRLPQPEVAAYQWKIREAFNPNNLTGSYYRTVTPSRVGME